MLEEKRLELFESSRPLQQYYYRSFTKSSKYFYCKHFELVLVDYFELVLVLVDYF